MKTKLAYVNLIDLVYPVGAMYISNVVTNPQTLFGGSWTQVTNAVLRAYNGAGYTGSDTHAITVNEMPSHVHQTGRGFHNCSTGSGIKNISWEYYPGDGISENYTANSGGGQRCPFFLEDITATFGTGLLNLFGGE